MNKQKVKVAAAVLIVVLMLCACGQQPSGAAQEAPSPSVTGVIPPAAVATDSVPPTANASDDAPPAAAEDPVLAKMESMSLREKVGQLFIIRPDSLDPSLTAEQIDDSSAEGVTRLSDAMRATLAEYPVGGIAFFGKNIVDPAQFTAFISDFQNASAIPLFAAIDEEGGLVSRLANTDSFDLPKYESATAVAASGDPADAQAMGQTIGNYLRENGINLNFAPVADVNTNPDNPIIGTRTFSDDPELAASMVAACIHGLHDSGVMCCIKHFPGHGDTSTDTHYGCASTEKTWEEMLACEMLPFKAGIEAGTDMIMVAHITASKVSSDELPATLSKEIVTGKLRGELSYNGVVITDALAMRAINDFFSSEESALMALEAGVDILLMPEDFRAAFDAVMSAVENGTISQQRLDESVYRILSLKDSYGLMP